MLCGAMIAAMALCLCGSQEAYATETLSSGTIAEKAVNADGRAKVQSLIDYHLDSRNVRTLFESSAYDVTGDGYADDVLFQMTRGSYAYSALTVFVNGSAALRLSPKYGAFSLIAQVVTLKNNKPFLFVKFYGNNMDGIHGLYQFKNGAFKKIADHNSFSSKTKQANHRYISDVSVSGNKVTLTYSYMTMFAGSMKIKQAYKYSSKGATLKKSGSSTKSVSYYAAGKNGYGKHKLTALKSFSVFTGKNLKRVKFKVAKNSKVKIVAAATSKGNLLLKVSSGGKTGWLKSKGIAKTKTNPYGGSWFKESMLAG